MYGSWLRPHFPGPGAEGLAPYVATLSGEGNYNLYNEKRPTVAAFVVVKFFQNIQKTVPGHFSSSVQKQIVLYYIECEFRSAFVSGTAPSARFGNHQTLKLHHSVLVLA